MGKNTLTDEEQQQSAEQKILEAAREEFGAKGFYGARTQAIADAAGLNKALLHYYFRSKEKLYSQTIRMTLKNILTRTAKARMEPGPVEQRLERMVDAYLESISLTPSIVKIILREVVDGGDRLRRVFNEVETREFIDKLMGDFDPVGQMARDLGVTPDQAIHLLMNMVGMCLISFIGPLMLEGVLRYDTSDFTTYLNERRTAIKAMLSAYVRSRMQELKLEQGQ